MTVCPSHLPRYPEEHYRVDRLFDLPSFRRNSRFIWGALTDGPASYDEAFDAVADNIRDVRTICDAAQGLRVTHIKNGQAQDVTAAFLAMFAEVEESAA